MNRTILMVALVGTMGLGLAGCGTNPVTGERELMLISTEQEIAMGREAAPQLAEELGGLVPDPTLQQYIQQVGTRVAANSHRPELDYQFALVRSEQPNALALPGGYIFITQGLFERMGNEAELAAVLGHEVAHVAARHNIQGLQRAMGVQLFAEVLGAVIGGTGGSVAQAGTQIAGGMFNLRYSRSAEYEADLLGMEYLARSNYNPYGMVLLLETLSELGGGGVEMLQTHPLTENRIAEVQQVFRQEYPNYSPEEPRGFNTETFRRMQARLR